MHFIINKIFFKRRVKRSAISTFKINNNIKVKVNECYIE